MNSSIQGSENQRPSINTQIETPNDSEGGLTEPLRVRVTSDSETDLNRIEAYFRGQGFKHANRSHIIRIALNSYVNNVQVNHPEIFE